LEPEQAQPWVPPLAVPEEAPGQAPEPVLLLLQAPAVLPEQARGQAPAQGLLQASAEWPEQALGRVQVQAQLLVPCALLLQVSVWLWV
jgi:hypothetical protein